MDTARLQRVWQTLVAISDQATADPTNCLRRQLFGGLDGHEAHIWSADRLADGLRVIPIVLVGLDIGRDELRTDQSDIVVRRRDVGAEVGRVEWTGAAGKAPLTEGRRRGRCGES